jgi:hypothetical protein
MNAVFTMKDTDRIVKLFYENLVFNCVKHTQGIFLFASDEYTAKYLDCEVHQVCGEIRSVKPTEIEFDFYDKAEGYEAKCLYTYQTSVMPWLNAIMFPERNMLAHQHIISSRLIPSKWSQSLSGSL